MPSIKTLEAKPFLVIDTVTGYPLAVGRATPRPPSGSWVRLDEIRWIDTSRNLASLRLTTKSGSHMASVGPLTVTAVTNHPQHPSYAVVFTPTFQLSTSG